MSIGRIIRFSAVAVLALALLVVLRLSALRDKVDEVREEERRALAMDVKGLAETIEQELLDVQEDVRYLAAHPLLSNLISKELTRNDTANRKAQNFQWNRDIIEREFKRRLDTRATYSQIRLIEFANEGQELIRVERLDSGATQAVPANKLQRKRFPGGYVETIENLESDFYSSAIELNREKGAIERPFRPVVRVAMRLHRENGSHFGFVIINYDFRDLEKRLAMRAIARDYSLYLTNQDDYFLVHPDRTKSFRFEPERSIDSTPEVPKQGLRGALQYGDAGPERLDPIFDPRTDVIDTSLLLADGKRLHARRVLLNRAGRDQFVVVGMASGDGILLRDMRSQTSWATYLQVGLLGLVGAFLFWLSRRLVTPIKRMTEAASAFAEGKPRGELPTDASAEVGALARSMEIMMTRVRAGQRAMEARRTTVLQTVFDAVVSIRPDGIIESSNDAAQLVFGYDARTMENKPIRELMPSGGDKLPEYVERAAASDVPIELQGIRKNGQRFPLMFGVRLVELPEGAVYTAVLRDITRQKAAEAELVRSANDARTAHERALQANRAMKDYVAEMGHDLRAPLVPMHMAASIMLKKADTYTPDQIRKKCEQIKGAVDHQSRLLTAILDLSRIEAGKVDIDPQPLSVEGVMQKAVHAAAMAGEAAKETGANELEVESPKDVGQVFAVEDHVVRILVNLLTNAHKFTDNGTITLSAQRKEEDQKSWVEFRVRDTGKGMTQEQLDGLFQAYGQTKEDRENRKRFGGAGLGLAITQRLCIAMGGTIHAESVVGDGTTFVVRLPATVRDVRDVREPEEAPAVVESASKDRYTVLLIDDDPSLRAGVRETLEEEGMRVVTAADAARGLELARAIRPDVITLDIVMRDMDGWQVLQRLKSDPELAKIPTIILSIIEERQRGYSLGAVDYITKPFEMDALASAIWKHCGNRLDKPILVVDDDANVRSMLTELLSAQGLRTLQAENGEVALAQLEHEPALILLDLEMPVMDGFEFLKKLRASETHANIPVIVVTGLDLSPEQAAQLHKNVANVVRKQAADTDDLARQVRNAVRGYRRGEAQ